MGKAKSIRKRVASHFANVHVRSSPGHAEMVAQVENIECVVVANEAEALLAELSFIKQYRPRFNIRLRDDKSYPFIAIDRRGLPTGVFHARAFTAPDALISARGSKCEAGTQHARSFGKGLHVSLVHRS